MRIIDEIRDQHRLIDRVVGSLLFWADRGSEDPAAIEDLTDLVHFLRVYVHGFHHHREEVLFRALVEHGEVPGHHGPLAVLTEEHERMSSVLDELAAAGACAESESAARTLAAEIWQHLDKEETVLLPEAERRLIDGGIRELDGPPASDDVEPARRLGLDLVQRLPPVDDPDLIRGDGCIPCAAFGDTCHGIETEWWSDWEMEHHRSLDEG
jgi:hemerythrin-like domain-containing protein